MHTLDLLWHRLHFILPCISPKIYFFLIFSWKISIQELHDTLYIHPAPTLFYVLENILKCQVTQQPEVGKDSSPNHTEIANKKRNDLTGWKCLRLLGVTIMWLCFSALK